jgi:hypothetical protein
MANLKGLESIVSQLREQRTNFVNQLRHVDAALAVLGKLEGGRSYTAPRRHARRTMSAAARRRISLAQKARWAKRNSGRAGVPKRYVSAASRRRMSLGQKRRWKQIKSKTVKS